MKKFLWVVLFVSFFGSCSFRSSKEISMEPVQDFEIDKYLGQWYEIARLPNWFEKDLINVTATYEFLNNGKVKVINKGYNTRKKRYSEVTGKARFAGAKNIGYLKVSFFWPFYADYKIIELDRDGYGYALVASSSKYLWILSKSPQLDEKTTDMLVKRAESLGFDVGKLYFTPQEQSRNDD
jgi:apolipoprotein D and lipocalin family protein